MMARRDLDPASLISGLVIAVCGLALAWPRVGLGLAAAAAIGLAVFFKPPGSGLVRQLTALPLLVPILVIAVLAALAWLGISRRRRAQRKHAGLRVLR